MSRPSSCENKIRVEAQPRRPRSDEALVAVICTEPHAFTELYERYLDPVYRYCHLRLGNHEDAEDATSEIFLKAFANLHTYRGGSFPGWLFRIAHNHVIDTSRRRRTTQRLASTAELTDPQATPEELVMTQADRSALRSALSTLPEEQRTAIELQLAGWSSKQSAGVLGKSIAATKMLRYRAINRLRSLLRPTDCTEREIRDESL
ncbi:MAG: sigma-70 family RNA polymerase sigma factor [Chloroflexales bacterium]|nr:sigma-70 family RNA polymerase sigma factor [Chloroflexales bacterium]